MTTQSLRPRPEQAETLETLEMHLATIEDDIEIMRQSDTLAADDMIATYCTKARLIRRRIQRLRDMQKYHLASPGLLKNL